MTSRKKVSIDFEVPIIDKMNSVKSKYKEKNHQSLSSSKIVNDALSSTLLLDNDIKKSIISHLDEFIDHINIEISLSDNSSYRTDDLNRKSQQIIRLKTLLSDYEGYSAKNPSNKFYNIKIKSGVAHIPASFILLNGEDAEQALYVYIIEVEKKSGSYSIPHFVFFSQSKDLSDKQIEEIYDLCEGAFPDFKLIRAREVQPIYSKEPHVISNMVNYEEYKNSENIGVFKLMTSEKIEYIKSYDSHYKPPYSAYIQLY